MDEERTGKLKRLPSSSVRLITSTQVITSVSSVVKELMENSLDAGSSSIEIYLDEHGLDRIEVRDNGHGIDEPDVRYMCRRSYTSKISDFSDLDKLSSYGFRGEALFSVCSVANVSVTTISKGRPYAKTYKFNHDGEVVESKPANLDKGTIITVTNLFKNLPVRKHFLTSGKRKQDEMKKVEMVVKALALVNCEVKIRLFHNKFTIFQKASVCSITRSLIQVLPPSLVKQLQEINYENEEEKIKFTLLIPKQDCNLVTTCLGHSLEATYLFINSRPVREKQLEKAVQEMVFGFFGSRMPPKKYPAMLVSIILPPDMVDVNLEPNKTIVMIKDIEKLIQLLVDQISIYYYGMDEESMMKEAIAMDPPKRKITTRESSGPTKKAKKCGEVNSFTLDSVSSATQNASPSQTVESHKTENAADVLPSEIEPIPTPILDNEQDVPKEKPEPDKATTIANFIDGLEQVPLSSSLPQTSSEEVSACKVIVPEDPFDVLKKAKMPHTLNPEPVQESEFFSQEFSENKSLTPVEEADIAQESNDQKSHLEAFSLSQWSRGVVEVDGKRLEGTTVLASHSSEEITDKTQSSVDDSKSERSVSSLMGQKDMSAFSKFAREMRKEIVKADPCISFPKIAKELSKRWQELQEEDKLTYKEMALNDKSEKKNKVNPNVDIARSSVPKRKTCEDVRPVFVKVYPTIARARISLGTIREVLKHRLTSVAVQTPEIIFNVNDDLSLVKGANAVFALSCLRLNEGIKFYNNLNHMYLDLDVLSETIVINEEETGELWSVLDMLDSSPVACNSQFDTERPPKVLTDERITKNGFRIEKMESSSGNKYIITHAAKGIANYGTEELKEILTCIAKDKRCKLWNCRPLKAINFIRSQTVESLTGQDFSRTDYTIDLYKHWSNKISHKQELCPHGRPVSKKIYP